MYRYFVEFRYVAGAPPVRKGLVMGEPVQLSEKTREFLRAVASESRQQILWLFTDGVARSVGEVAAEVGIGQSTASEQLAILRRGGLVCSERDGRVVRYCADAAGIGAALEELQAMLRTYCPPGSTGC